MNVPPESLTPDTSGHLFWGYAAIWICLALFLFLVNREQRRQNDKLRVLGEELERLRGANSPG